MIKQTLDEKEVGIIIVDSLYILEDLLEYGEVKDATSVHIHTLITKIAPIARVCRDIMEHNKGR